MASCSQFSSCEEETLKDQSVIHDTQSAMILEDLIGKFLLNSVNSEEER